MKRIPMLLVVFALLVLSAAAHGAEAPPLPPTTVDVSALTTVTDAAGITHGLGLLHEVDAAPRMHFSPTPQALPDAYDLRALGFVSPIKDQGSCGDCWAHAITENLEDAILHAGGKPVDLSVQQITSCAKDAYGCQGGFMTSADYVVDPGLAADSAWPFKGSTGRCKAKLPPVAGKATSWAFVGAEGRSPTTDEIKQVLYKYGSVFVTVAAGGADWDGRGSMDGCYNSGTNHMVEIVGWTKDGQWIMRNSWGSSWGDNGFALMPYGCDGIATESDSAAFVVPAMAG